MRAGSIQDQHACLYARHNRLLKEKGHEERGAPQDFRPRGQGGPNHRCHWGLRFYSLHGPFGPWSKGGVGRKERTRSEGTGRKDKATGRDSLLCERASSKYEDGQKVVQRTVEEFGFIDILPMAAGINNNGPIDQQDREEWQLVVDLNLKGTHYFQRVPKVIKEKGGGKVTLVGSVRGLYGLANHTAYCASKGAVHMLTKSPAL